MRISRSTGWLVLFLLLALVVVSGCQAPAAQPTPTAVPAAVAQPTQSQGGNVVPKQYSAPPPMTIDPNKSYEATLHTTKGDMKIDLLPKEAPKTVNNFVFLARDGFYANVPFHRIMTGFMVQTGDPTGTGTGSPGYRFADEPVKREYKRGIVAMANSGPNTNGSQFFIMHADYGLQPNYTIFGQVTDKVSLETLDKIASTPVKASPRGEKSVPTEDVRINSVDITEK
jgi:cyclophilin family peptidyl-prolyl cis-trans isomerase